MKTPYINPLPHDCSHEFGEWSWTFEPGDGSFSYYHTCCKCNVWEVQNYEPDGFVTEGKQLT